MTFKPRVSVIMSVFNGVGTVGSTIDSILAQQFDDFSFIIVDDASTDATPEILASYAHKDPRIKIITNLVNQERCVSRNIAIQAAKSDYIAIMDADDIALPSRLTKQVAFLDEHPEIDICGSFIDTFGEEAGIQPRPVTHEAIGAQFLFGNPLAHSTVMGRRILFESAQYDATFPLAEDFELFSRMAFMHSARFHNIPEPLVRYYVHHSDAFRPWHAKVLLQSLKAIGLAPNELEQKLHTALSLDSPKAIAERFAAKEIFTWLDTVYSHTVASGVLSSHALMDILCRKTIDIARHSSLAETVTALAKTKFIRNGSLSFYCRLGLNLGKNAVGAFFR